MLNITQVKIFKNDTGNIKASVSITIDGSFVVTGLKVIQGTNGLFVSMPSQKKQDGTYKDICFPVTAEARTTIQDAVLKEYGPSDADMSMEDDELDF